LASECKAPPKNEQPESRPNGIDPSLWEKTSSSHATDSIILPQYWVCQEKIDNEILSRGAAYPAVNNSRFADRITVPQTIQMPVDLPETTSKMGGPLVKQFSVFLPNKVGAMLDIVKMLNTNNTHVVAMSVSESTDSAIARIVVSDPERVEKLFRQNTVAFGVCEVVVVEMREVATQLVKLLAALFMAEVNVHFTYPLLTRPRGFAALALHVDDTECASSVLMGEGFKILSQSDISR
jgi:ACT domain-containing protein